MIANEDLPLKLDKPTLWKKYCGFLDLSTEEFMVIQAQLLLEQIELISNSPLAKKIMGERKPTSIQEFRDTVPVTTYEDYIPYLEEKRDDVLAEKPFCWVHTSGLEGNFKWVPYTSRGYNRLIDSLISALILASANKKGEVNIKKGARIIFHLPTRPYLCGHFAFGLSQRLECQAIPSLEMADRISLEEKGKKEFDLVKKHGADFIFSLPDNLADMGVELTEQLNRSRPTLFSVSSLRSLMRLAHAKLSTRIKDRPILPRHLYQTKGAMCVGADSYFYKQEIEHYWGKKPYDIYLATETGCIAFPSWDGDAMTFTPFSGFLEFIPEEEWAGGGEAESSHPNTLLLNELEVGKRYEILVTNFYGMPFLRYKLGDIIKITATKNKLADIGPPQLLYESRISDIVNIGDSQEINEKKIWQALLNSGLKYEDWFLMIEESNKKNTFHLYIELKNIIGAEVENLIFNSRVPIEVKSRDLPYIPDIPLKITILPRGTFQRYRKEKDAAGFDSACLKVVRINPQDDLIRQIIYENGAS